MHKGIPIGIAVVIVIVIVVYFQFIVLPPEQFENAQTEVESEELEYFRAKSFTPIEDYSLISELIEDGFMSTDQETRKALLEYKGNSLYDSECSQLLSEYMEAAKDKENWIASGRDGGDYPNNDLFAPMFKVFNRVCAFADVSDLAE